MSNLARWAEIFAGMGLSGDPLTHAELRRHYSEPSRVYHTLHHVAECLDAVFPAVPYCVDLIGGPYLETNDEVCKGWRPKTAIRTPK